MRILILVSLVLCSLNIHAETENDSVKAGRDPFYLQLYLGINKSANENLPWTEFSGYPWANGVFIALGRELSPLWG